MLDNLTILCEIFIYLQQKHPLCVGDMEKFKSILFTFKQNSLLKSVQKT